MQNSEKRNYQIFVDFIPAQLHENKVWEIVYYIKNPITEKLERKRNRVRPLKKITERRKLAKRMVIEINKRLDRGEILFKQKQGLKNLTKITDAIGVFKKRIAVEYKAGNHRFDTYKTYKSQLKQLEQYINAVLETPNLMCYNFDSEFIGDYLDYIRYEKKQIR